MEAPIGRRPDLRQAYIGASSTAKACFAAVPMPVLRMAFAQVGRRGSGGGTTFRLLYFPATRAPQVQLLDTCPYEWSGRPSCRRRKIEAARNPKGYSISAAGKTACPHADHNMLLSQRGSTLFARAAASWRRRSALWANNRKTSTSLTNASCVSASTRISARKTVWARLR
jgi:hypothetical protein